ncbi:MAG: hypothetical protein ACUVQQ_07070 [Thermogutta sp.]
MSRWQRMLGAAAICGAIALVGLPAVAAAQNTAMQTVAAVAIGGVDRLMQDAEYLGKLSGNPQLGEMMKAMIAAQTGGSEGIPGLDSKRPVGVLVQTDGLNFQVYGMVPVTKLDDLLKLASRAGITAEKQGDVYAIEGPQQTIFAVEKNGWLVLGMDKPSLAAAPADPAVLQQLAGSYDLAVKINIQSIPPMYRQLAIALIQQGMQQGMQPTPDQTPEEFELQKRMTMQTLSQIQDALNEYDTITVGLNLDAAAGNLAMDVQMTVLPNSKAARLLEANADLTTALAGFARTDDTFLLQATAKYTPEYVDLMKQQFENYKKLIAAGLKKDAALSAKERKLVLEIVDQVFAQLMTTMEKHGADIAISGSMTAIVGGMVLDNPAVLETRVKELFEDAKQQNPELAERVKLDAEVYSGVRFHVLQIPNAEIAEGSPEFAKLLEGKDLQAVLGVGEHAIYLTAGADAVNDLKAALDSSKERKPVDSAGRFRVALKPIMQFVLAMSGSDSDDERAQIEELLSVMSGDGDEIRIESKLIPNGTHARIEFGEDVLKLIGAAVQKGIAATGQGLSPDEF